MSSSHNRVLCSWSVRALPLPPPALPSRLPSCLQGTLPVPLPQLQPSPWPPTPSSLSCSLLPSPSPALCSQVDGGTMSRLCEPLGLSSSCIPGCKGMYDSSLLFCEQQADGHHTSAPLTHMRRASMQDLPKLVRAHLTALHTNTSLLFILRPHCTFTPHCTSVSDLAAAHAHTSVLSTFTPRGCPHSHLTTVQHTHLCCSYSHRTVVHIRTHDACAHTPVVRTHTTPLLTFAPLPFTFKPLCCSHSHLSTTHAHMNAIPPPPSLVPSLLWSSSTRRTTISQLFTRSSLEIALHSRLIRHTPHTARGVQNI